MACQAGRDKAAFVGAAAHEGEWMAAEVTLDPTERERLLGRFKRLDWDTRRDIMRMRRGDRVKYMRGMLEPLEIDAIEAEWLGAQK